MRNRLRNVAEMIAGICREIVQEAVILRIRVRLRKVERPPLPVRKSYALRDLQNSTGSLNEATKGGMLNSPTNTWGKTPLDDRRIYSRVEAPLPESAISEFMQPWT
jgi:hypothetical protein